MLTLTNLIPAVLLALASSTAIAAKFEFGSLQIDWPEGFIDQPSRTDQPPHELAGPAGEKVLVTTMRRRNDVAKESSAADRERSIRGHEEFLRKQAEKAGTIAVPVTREVLPDGSVLLYTASARRNRLLHDYFLQYMVVSPVERIGFFTIEGRGKAEEQHLRFLPAIKTIVWLQ